MVIDDYYNDREETLELNRRFDEEMKKHRAKLLAKLEKVCEDNPLPPDQEPLEVAK